MNICWLVRRRLTAYLDREVGQATAVAIERHLGTCAPCGAELEAIRRVTHLLRSIEPPSRAAGYWPCADQRLQEKIQALPGPARYPTLHRFCELIESPYAALIPLTLICAAIINTLGVLGLEEEVVSFVSSYLLPIALD